MKITFKGKEVKLIGTPPAVGEEMPNFTVQDKNNHEFTKSDLLGKFSLISDFHKLYPLFLFIILNIANYRHYLKYLA